LPLPRARVATPSPPATMSSGSHLSKSFFDVIKAIGESKSKQEEDRIITLEVQELKKQLSDRTCVGKKLKEFLLRILYVEMLGHNGSFGYMKAVELSASSNLLEKRVAYLVAGLCFGPDHDFRMMLVNRLQRDLQSANVLELAIALPAAARILTVDMIPAVLPLVSNLLKHDQEIVRKKAIMVLQRFHQLQPESVSHMTDKFRRVLCDKDPSVMSASLHLFYDLARADPSRTCRATRGQRTRARAHAHTCTRTRTHAHAFPPTPHAPCRIQGFGVVVCVHLEANHRAPPAA
ncbi:hypothetical protein EON66_11025, partial [archaeon]